MASRNMTALLTMLALAGWQNRDRIGEWLGGMATGQKPGGPSTGADPGVKTASSDAGDWAACLVDCLVLVLPARKFLVDWAN